VNIPSTLTNLTIQGISSQSGDQPVIVFPTTDNPQTTTFNADPLVMVDGATGVTIHNLEISGPFTGCAAYNATHYGIYVGAAGSATITKDDISEIRSVPSSNESGCQDGVGIGVGQSYPYVSSPPPPDHGSAVIENDVVENYQKDGIRVDGSSGTPSNVAISNNTVSGIGPTSVAAASNGIEVLDSSTGTISDNNVSGNQYTPSPQASGILLDSSGAVTVSGNTLTGNDNGIYDATPTAAVTIENNSVTNESPSTGSEGIELDSDTSGSSVTGNTVSSGADGIDLFGGTTGAQIGTNTVMGAGSVGIFDESSPTTIGNTFTSNTASGSGTYDCLDQNAAAGGTAGTGNTWNNDTGTTASPAAICTPASPAGTVLYAINAGGGALSSGGTNWGADTSGSPSTLSNAGSSNNNTFGTTATINVGSTGVPQAVFQASRYSTKTSPDLTWNFPEPTGTNVTVKLDFAELYAPCFKVNCRTFDVFIGTTKVLGNFDIYKTAGAGDKGIVESFNATSVGGNVTITFAHEIQEPMVNGIEILSR
jgi:hypothetical protein